MEVKQKVIPYNTGKVQIGILYVPKCDYLQDEDASLLQSVLLKQKVSIWSCASSATLASLALVVGFVWLFVLFAINVKW